jgi:hypothetical protein
MMQKRNFLGMGSCVATFGAVFMRVVDVFEWFVAMCTACLCLLPRGTGTGKLIAVHASGFSLSNLIWNIFKLLVSSKIRYCDCVARALQMWNCWSELVEITVWE